MKFKIIQPDAEENKTEKVIGLKLRTRYGASDDVTLVACNEAGKEFSSGCIVTIRSSGVILRESHLNPALGFQIDEDRKIKEID